jgi:hypothetical protein
MTTINGKEYELINKILEAFDFEKCYITMTLLKWEWAQVGGRRTPTIQELKESARNHLLSAFEGIKNEPKMGIDSPYMVSSGGLKASVFKNRYNHITFAKLEFILTEWDEEP